MAYGISGEVKIVKETDAERFVERVHELFEEGFMPANTLETFAEWDDDEREWKTLHVMAFFRDMEREEFPGASAVEVRQMFS